MVWVKDLILACAEKCVVLIDCKKQFTLCPYKRAIVLDRCDMYMDDASSALSEYKGNAIILVDTKQIPKFKSYDFCSIRLMEGRILVV